MQYTKGICGPKSAHDMTVMAVVKDDRHGKMAQLIVEARLKNGPRMARLLLQGKHRQALGDTIRENMTFRAEARWTARDAATVTQIISGSHAKAA